MSTIDSLVLNAESNDEFIKQLMSSIVLATKESNTLPQRSDYQYYAMAPEFKKTSKKIGNETIGLIDKVCALVNPGGKLRLPDDMGDPLLYEQIVDVIDALLEGADRSMEGTKSKESRVSNAVNQTLSLDKQRVLQQNSKEIEQPQKAFWGEICNFRHVPFKPRMKEQKDKYHATTALDLKARHVDLDAEEALSNVIRPETYYVHPYETELRQLKVPTWCVTGDDVVHVNPMPTYSQFPFTLVDKVEAFDDMLQKLAGKTELAVDLEHHSYHTYQGLTCLIQISSREQDFIVDALALRRQLPRLGACFANPDVVKVLHGCDKDVLWLQRDCGLYLVNCFDTHVAAKALGYPALSLAHLLKVHCGISADKKHQLSDWRERPLPADMLHYANEDTRYLLYVYDRVRQEMWKKLGKAGLEHVFNASKQLCLARYEIEPFDPEGYTKLFQEKSSSRAIPKLEALTSLQRATLAAVWDWRDQAARVADESPAALMSNAELLRVGLNLPQTELQLEQVCGPLSAFTRSSAAQLLSIVASVTSLGPSAAATPIITKKSSDTAGLSAAHANIPDPISTTPRSKRSKLSSTSHDGELSVNPDSVYTFTPAMPLSPNVTAGHRHFAADVINSPVPQTEEIFRQAGWSTPIYKANQGNSAPSPPLYESTKSKVSEDTKARIAKSQESVGKSCAEKVQATQVQLQQRQASQAAGAKPAKVSAKADSAPSTAAAQQVTSEDKTRITTVDLGGYSMDIPKSFEEVYQLSHRNRQRNKDKRRGGGASGGGEDDDADGDNMDVVGDVGDSSDREDLLAAARGASSGASWDAKALRASKIDPSFYLTASADIYKDANIDDTLDMAQSLGWVNSKVEGAALKDAHLQDLSYQQAEGAGAGEDGIGSVKSDQSGNALRRSFEKTGKAAPSGSGSSAKVGGSNKGTAVQHGQQPGIASGQGNSSTTDAKRPSSGKLSTKSFVYPTNNAMGALPSNAPAGNSKDDSGYGNKPGSGKQKSGPGQQRSKSGDSGTANPYFFGTK